MVTGCVRPFVDEDIPQVAELHRRTFAAAAKRRPELEQSYQCYFREVFLDNPWRDESLPSLVYQEGNDKITGFLGVTPRPLQMNGKPVRAAVSSMFMVDSNGRSGLAAVQLLRTFLSGPQDLSLADEATSPSRRLWERFDGATSLLYSMYWIRPLRLARFLSVRLSRRSPLAKVVTPFCWAADAVLARVMPVPAHPQLLGEDLDPQTLLEVSTAMWSSQALRPEYNADSLGWLLDMARHAGSGGVLEKVAVRNPGGKLVGWYVCYLTRDHIAEVLQIESKPGSTSDVLDHLLDHARRRGAVAATGRFDPRLVQELGSGFMMNPRYWMLVHSRKPELLNALECGDSALTRLEGEWCLQFHSARYRGLSVAGHTGKPRQALAIDASPSVKAERGGVEVVEALAEGWRQLCDESPWKEPFCRPEWIAAYLRAFAARAKVVVITARVGNVLKAVLPLIEERGFFCGVPVTKLRGAANAHSCRFDMVRSAGPEGDAAVLATWRFLKELPGWDLIELPDVPQDGVLEGLLEAARLDGFPVGRKESMVSPYVPLYGLGDGPDPWLLRTSANFRSNVRRKGRQLRSRGPLTLQRSDKADPALLQKFYELESLGWKGKQETAIACHKNTRQFYDEIARNGERFGYLSLYSLEFDGHPIAAQFGITYGGRYFMPKLAIDEDYRPYGPGHLLINEILRDCVDRGILEYDFTGPWAEYKAKWASANRSHSNLWIFRQGAAGQFLHAMKFKVEAALRETLRPWLHAVRRNGASQPSGE